HRNFNFDSHGVSIYTITVNATDADTDWTGDKSSSSASQSVTVSDDDTAGPVIVLGGSSGSQNDGQIQSFTWNVSDVSGLSALSVAKNRDHGTAPGEIYRA